MRAVVGSIQGVPRPASISAWLQALSLSLPYRSSFVFLQGQGLLLHRELLARSLPLLLEHDRGCLHRDMPFRVFLVSLSIYIGPSWAGSWASVEANTAKSAC